MSSKKGKKLVISVLFLLFAHLMGKFATNFIQILFRSTIFGVFIAIDSTVGLLFKDISILLSWIILGIIGYGIQRTISEKIYGTFSGKQILDIIVVLLAFPVTILISAIFTPGDYSTLLFVSFRTPSVYVVIPLLFYPLVLGVVFSSLLTSQSDFFKMRGPSFKFWRLIGNMERQNAVKEYVADMQVNNTLLKSLNKIAWMYGPGLTLAGICFIYGFIFHLLSASSLIFAGLVISWSFAHVKYSLPEKNILNALLALTINHFKGMMGLVLLIYACLLPVFLFFLFTSAVMNKQLPLYALVMVGPLIYCIYFWYTQTRRFPYFVDTWTTDKNHHALIKMPALPVYGYLPFVLICFLFPTFSYIFVRCWKNPALFVFSYCVLSALSLIIIGFSLKKNYCYVSRRRVIKENHLIALSMLTQTGMVSLLFIGLDIDCYFLFFISLLVIFIWYYPDWCRLLRHRYDATSIKRIILRFAIIPVGLLPALGVYVSITKFFYIGVCVLETFFMIIVIMGRRAGKRNKK